MSAGVLFGAPTFAELEPSLRTGDVILYSDPDAAFATRRTLRQMKRAAGLARLLSFLPCATHENLRIGGSYGGGDGTDDDDRDDNGTASTCRLDFEGDFEDARQAAFVIELVDETHTNPQNDLKKMLPFVFVPGNRAIVPAREFVAALRDGEPRFAVRRLSIANEQDTSHTVNKQRIRTVLGQRLFQHCAYDNPAT